MFPRISHRRPRFSEARLPPRKTHRFLLPRESGVACIQGTVPTRAPRGHRQRASVSPATYRGRAGDMKPKRGLLIAAAALAAAFLPVTAARIDAAPILPG